MVPTIFVLKSVTAPVAPTMTLATNQLLSIPSPRSAKANGDNKAMMKTAAFFLRFVFVPMALLASTVAAKTAANS